MILTHEDHSLTKGSVIERLNCVLGGLGRLVFDDGATFRSTVAFLKDIGEGNLAGRAHVVFETLPRDAPVNISYIDTPSLSAFIASSLIRHSTVLACQSPGFSSQGELSELRP